MEINAEKGVRGFIKAYENAEELEKKIDEYFDNTLENECTRSGLALYLGITTKTLKNYENGTQGDDIKFLVERAITRIEAGLEKKLINVRGNPTGTIFALKNVAGWKDNQDVEVKSSGFEIVCNVPRPEEK